MYTYLNGLQAITSPIYKFSLDKVIKLIKNSFKKILKKFSIGHGHRRANSKAVYRKVSRILMSKKKNFKCSTTTT